MNNSQLTNRINAVLAEKGIDKKTFYESCGITSSAFSQWATGKTTPRISKLNEISAFLGVPVERLIGLTDVEDAIQNMYEAHARGLMKGMEDGTPMMEAYIRQAELRDLAYQSRKQKQKPAVSDELVKELEILQERPEIRSLLHAAADMTPEQVRNIGAMMESFRGGVNGQTD